MLLETTEDWRKETATPSGEVSSFWSCTIRKLQYSTAKCIAFYYILLLFIAYYYLTYLPHKAVAEVSKDKEPIGRECAEFNWFESQSMSDSNELRVKWFGCHLIWDSNDFGCQLMCAWNDFGCLLNWTSIEVVVNWFEIQAIWLSIDVWLSVDLNFKWFGCQLIWDSSELVVNWCVIQMILVVSWCESQRIWSSNYLEIQVSWLSTDVWFKWFWLWVDVGFKWFGFRMFWDSSELVVSWFEIQVIWLSIDLRFKAFLRDFLQKWSFEDQKTKLFCETSFKNDMSTRRLTSEFQYVLTIFMWTLQKYCACHEKVEPRHTKSCNYHAKWSLQSNTSVTWNLQPFHGFSVANFKHRLPKARNPCACHAKRIVSDPLQIPHACQRFCNPHELLRLPRILQRV